MQAKTTKERVADFAKRMKERGLVKVWAWCYPEDRDEIRKYAERLRKRREKP